MDLSEFRYLIEDIFEVKCGRNAGECREWVSWLIRRNSGSRQVELLSGFLIGDAFVILKAPGGEAPRRLLLIDSRGARKINLEKMSEAESRARF
ncbi:MAG TPA: hypothetical protein PKL97_06370 [Candidatus Omnitrophota bacterium]|nr:hypothetical protein [Candidatus Omnitrophota bacterium]